MLFSRKNCSYLICLLCWSWGKEGVRGESYNYTINRTWNNQTTEDSINLSLSIHMNDDDGIRSLLVEIDAPFFNDPLAPDAPTEEPLMGLWDYEVVEAFFLGANGDYLELEFAPSGHYLTLYLWNYRNDSGRYLPLKGYTANVYNITEGSTPSQRWKGRAEIPFQYLPLKVQRFNAYAIHKSDEDRRYMSLFPANDELLPEGPDFHYLDAFQEIELFSEEMFPEYPFKINRIWNNQEPEDEAEIFLNLELTVGGEDLRIRIDAPFYNDPLAPDAPTDEPLDGLWEFEVVEAFFLGNGEEYIELEFAPSGHYLTLYLNGYRNDTGRYLPLNGYTTEIYNITLGDRRWKGEVLIPGEYFPCNVTRWNAYAIHKSKEDRRYMSLFPVKGDEITQPDFHYLEGFGNIEFGDRVEWGCNAVTGETSSTPPSISSTSPTTPEITSTSSTPPSISSTSPTTPEITPTSSTPPSISSTSPTTPEITSTSSTPPSISSTLPTTPEITSTSPTTPETRSTTTNAAWRSSAEIFLALLLMLIIFTA